MDVKAMVRRLGFACLTALLAAAWLRAPVPAQAQDAEPALVAPQETPDLSAPFDLQGAPKLSEDELRYVLSGGSRAVDGRRIRQGEGFLTLGELMPLLRETSAAGIQDLKTRKAEGKLGPEDWQKALRLLWERRLLLNKEDVAFLEDMLKRAYGKVPEKKENGPKAGPVKASPAAGLAQAAASADWGTSKDQLYVQMMDRLLLEDHGSAEELKAMKETVSKLLQSPTAREIAAQFVQTGAKVRLAYVTMPNSTLTEERGKKDFTGTMGLTYTSQSPMLVEMNKFYLQTSPDRKENAAVLAHELLGHAFRGTQARAKGLEKVMNQYSDDETNARLIEWVTQAELGGKLNSSLSWSYMKDPASYYTSLATAHPYYAQCFTRAGMEDPVKVLKERLGAIQAYVKSCEGWRGRLEQDRKAIEHFTKDPGHQKEYPPSSFNMVKTETDNRLDTYIPQWLAKWADMEKVVQAKIDYYRTPAGQAEMASLQQAAQDPFFKDLDAEVVRLTKVLKQRAAGRSEAEDMADPPPTPGQVTRDKLHEMIANDKAKHPEHWN